MLTLRIQDAKASKRSKDSNGFLIIKDNPIAKAGVFDYLLSELKEGINPKDDKVVKVYRPFSELVRIKESFANKPIKMHHSWVGEESQTADGAIGSNISADEANEYLRADLIIYNPKLIEAIEKDELVELSPAYTGKEIAENGRYNGEAYEFKQELGEVNHLAVVEIGRSGKDLKIYDNKPNKGVDFMKFKDKLMERFSKFLDSETSESETQDSDTSVEIAKEIIAVANKADGEFSGGADEKIQTILELAKKLNIPLADKTSEAESVTDEAETQDSEAEAQADEAESIAESEINIDEIAEAVAEVVEKVTEQKLKEFTDNQKKEAQKIADAYAEVKKALGADFDSKNMDTDAIYTFGYETLASSTLDKKMDAKTAFVLARDSKKATHKVSDSGEAKPSNIQSILQEKY